MIFSVYKYGPGKVVKFSVVLPTSRMVSEVMFPISESRLGKVVTFSVVLPTSRMVSEVMFPVYK